MSPIRFVAIGAISLSALALAGCGMVGVVSSDGEGTCEGKGDFAITSSQTTDASEYTVTYDGPDNVALVLSQGFYIDHLADLSGGIAGPGDADGALWSLTENDGEMYAYRIDTTNAGWSTTGSGANTHHEFTGTYDELIDGQLQGAALASDPADPEADTYLPAVVGVVCDDTVETGFFVESDEALDTIDTIEFAAATSVNPNHLLLDPMVIDSQRAEGNGLVGTAHFPASTADIFGGFVPTNSTAVAIAPDSDEMPNDTFSQLWFQVIVGGMGDPGLSLSFPDGLAPEGTFAWALEVSPETTSGNYIVTIPMEGTIGGNEEIRVAFMNLYYDADNGVAFLDPIGEPVNPDLSEGAELAETGVDAGAMALVSGGLVAAGAVVAVTRRRTV